MVFLLSRIVAAAFLVLGLGRWPYDFYTIMRWVVSGVSAYAAYTSVQQSRQNWSGIFVVLALAFNPVFPVHLSRDTWAPIDVLAAVILLVSAVDSVRRRG